MHGYRIKTPGLAAKPIDSSPNFRTPGQQPRGVQNERQFRCHVNEGRQQRIEKAEGRHSDSYAVHDQRTHEVLDDDPSTASRSPQRLDEFREVASNQDHIRALPSHVSSRTHSDANIGLPGQEHHPPPLRLCYLDQLEGSRHKWRRTRNPGSTMACF
jgi:hypothetical protein